MYMWLNVYVVIADVYCIYVVDIVVMLYICDPPSENRPCSHLVVIRETGV